jgi:hypothetical protein
MGLGVPAAQQLERQFHPPLPYRIESCKRPTQTVSIHVLQDIPRLAVQSLAEGGY